MRIYLHWKGLSSLLPPLINLILGSCTMYKNRFIVQLVPISFFLSQRGLEIVNGEGSFTFDHNVLKLETFPHLFQWFGALRFVYIKNWVSRRWIDAVWKCAITDVSGTSALPIHPSFLCLWDGAPPTPLGPCTLVSGPSKGGPSSFDPLHGCGKTFFCPTLCPGNQSFCRHRMLM